MRIYLRRGVLVVMLGWWVPLGGFAQSGASFTLEECINYALLNSLTIKNAAIDKDIARARVNEIIGVGMPQINGSVQVMHNHQLRRFYSTYNPDSEFNFVGDLSNINGIKPGDVVAAQNFFQLKSMGEAGLNISQLVLSGSYLVGIEASKGFKALTNHEYDVKYQQVIVNVTKAYYLLLINEERKVLYESNIARLDTLLRNTKTLYENGFAEHIDIDRIQVLYNNLNAEYDQFKGLTTIGYENIKLLMNYPMEQPLEIEGRLADISLETIDVLQQDVDVSVRPDYRVLQSNYNLQKLNIKNKITSALPSLVAFANLGYSTQSPNLAGVFKTNASFDETVGVGPDKWYGFSTFGATLSIPIFSGLQRTFQLQQEKLRLVQIENGIEALKQGIHVEVTSANTQYANALKSLDIQQQNIDLATEVARITKIKFEQGLGANMEVIQAENSLREAQVNYYNALYQALVARVDRDKAYGWIKQ